MEYFDRNPFQAPGAWYRGNTHTHTTVSDGQESSADRCEAYQSAGYDFLCITDHNSLARTDELSTDELLVVPGTEVDAPNPFTGSPFPYHIVALDPKENIDGRRHVNAVLDDIEIRGGVAIVAHPNYLSQSIFDLLPLRSYSAIEIFNQICHIDRARAYSEFLWDALLDKSDRPIYGIACDDAHYLEDRFAGWIMVKSRDLTVPSILDAIRNGMFYSTQGPQILDLQLTRTEIEDADGALLPKYELHVRTSPAKHIHVIAHTDGKPFDAPPGGSIEEVRFEFDHLRKYVRIEVLDHDGKKAWSQPIWLSSLRRDRPHLQVFRREKS